MKPDTSLTSGTATIEATTWTSSEAGAVDLGTLGYGCAVWTAGEPTKLELRFAAKADYCQALQAGLHDESGARFVVKPLDPWDGDSQDFTSVSVAVPTYARASNPQIPWSSKVCSYAIQGFEQGTAPTGGGGQPLVALTYDAAMTTVTGSFEFDVGSTRMKGSFASLPVFETKGFTQSLCCN